ncbi:MAG: hypothetical protein AB1757_15825 [Acidobacteriota bacterium]
MSDYLNRRVESANHTAICRALMVALTVWSGISQGSFLAALLFLGQSFIAPVEYVVSLEWV